MKVWLKAIRNGALAGALVGFLWASGLLGIIGVFWGPRGTRASATDDYGPGYLHRLWTYPIYGLVIVVLIVCLLGINKELRYIIAKTDLDDGKGSRANIKDES
jgi:hypothetical protein